MSIDDAERIAFLEVMARKSQTGISLDWVPSVEGEPSGFRFIRKFHIGKPCKTVREAIDRAITEA